MHQNSFIVVLGIGLACSGAAWAQAPAPCGTWTQELAQAGVNGTVLAMTTWDPDGAGPEPERVVIGGTFTTAGGVQTGYVAGWDGTAWRAMGSGIEAVFSSSLSFATVGGELVIGGDVRVGGSRVALARYVNGAWVNFDCPAGTAVDIAGAGDELVAVGLFTARAGKNTTSIGRWSAGTGWRTMGSVGAAKAVTWHSGAWYVAALMGGNISPRVASWTGSAWESLSSLEGDSEWASTPTQLLSVGGELWAIGRPVGSDVPRAMRREADAWVEREEGISPSLTTGRAYLAGGVLYREASLNTFFQQVFRRGASAWEPLGGQFLSTLGGMAASGGRLYAGAPVFGEDNGPSVQIEGVWQTAGNGTVGLPSVMAAWRGKTVVGGGLKRMNDVPVAGLLAREGNGWSPFADPLSWAAAPNVTAMAVHSDELVIGGTFTQGSGVPLSRVAAWNGLQWRSLGNGLPVVPSALVSSGGALYAAGFANAAGDGSGTMLTVWKQFNGQWQRIGGPVATATIGSRALLGVSGGTIAVSAVHQTTSAVTVAPSRLYRFTGGAWVGSGTLNTNFTGFAEVGGSLLLGGMAETPQGLSPLTDVSGVTPSPHPFGPYFPSGTGNLLYAFPYRDGMLLSAAFVPVAAPPQPGVRVIVAPQSGEGQVAASPGGVVRAFADDGVEAFGIVYRDEGGVEISRFSCACGAADVSGAGGLEGADGRLDNNDMIGFIGLFFDQHWRADVGQSGGLSGSDGLFNNNDFIAFINAFFAGCDG